LALLYKLALAKLFVDQALPSAGVSGTVVVAGSWLAKDHDGGVEQLGLAASALFK
jgi:hypothetical protein